MKYHFSILFFSILLTFCFKFHYSSNAQLLQGSFESEFKRYQKGDVFGGDQTQTWEVLAWRGERIHKQIILWSDVDIDAIAYQVSDLKGGINVIPSSVIRLRFGQYVRGDREARSCSEYEIHSTNVEIIDALRETEINRISATDPIKLWVTIDVPQTTEPGVYQGTIEVLASSEQLTFSVDIEVVEYTLPEASDWGFHLDLWQFPSNILTHYNMAHPNNKIELWSEKHFSMLKPSYTLLVDLGQKVVTTYIKDGSLGAPSMVTWIKKVDGSWEYDFSAFDKYVNFMFSLGIDKQISCFSPVGWNENIIPYFDEASGLQENLDAPLGSEDYTLRWNHFLTEFKGHLTEKGWFDRTVLYLDEVSEEKLNDVTTLVYGNDPNWKLGIAYSHGLTVSSKTKFYDLSGILEEASNEGIDDGKISTFYTSCTQKFPNSYITPENSPAEMTWMGWHALNQGYDGYLRWAFDYWSNNDPYDMRDGSHTAGDFGMVYRNSNDLPMEYSSSIRMEMLRAGIQDYEKIKILKGILQSSSDPFDKQSLGGLNSMIEKFGKTSGQAAEQLVSEAQELVRLIVLGEYSYCRVMGVDNKNYYLKELSTTGGEDNITFKATGFSEYGYQKHTTSWVNALSGADFNVNMENSTLSNCARMKVWIDWNGDEDFLDEGEEVFAVGNVASCENGLKNSFKVNVPEGIAPGSVRMRVRVAESNQGELTPCGTINKSETNDFVINITDAYCGLSGASYEEYFIASFSTEGGLNGQNIAYVANGFPENGYEYHVKNKVDVEEGDSFKINLKNSPSASCARTKIWADWNGDSDFDDDGEEIYNGDAFQSCNNNISKAINIKVPFTSTIGIIRMRIRLRDAWLDEPEACGDYSFTGAVDFIVYIKESTLVSGMGQAEHPGFIVFPNPSMDGNVNIAITKTSSQRLQITLLNMSGQVVYKINLQQQEIKDIITLPGVTTGIYLLKLSSESDFFNQKILIGKAW